MDPEPDYHGNDTVNARETRENSVQSVRSMQSVESANNSDSSSVYSGRAPSVTGDSSLSEVNETPPASTDEVQVHTASTPAPPRPSSRPSRPQTAHQRASRPIHILPANPYPEPKAADIELKQKLESLDKPGASDNPETTKLFTKIAQQIDAEGPFGGTSKILGLPTLGPQKGSESFISANLGNGKSEVAERLQRKREELQLLKNAYEQHEGPHFEKEAKLTKLQRKQDELRKLKAAYELYEPKNSTDVSQNQLVKAKSRVPVLGASDVPREQSIKPENQVNNSQSDEEHRSKSSDISHEDNTKMQRPSAPDEGDELVDYNEVVAVEGGQVDKEEPSEEAKKLVEDITGKGFDSEEQKTATADENITSNIEKEVGGRANRVSGRSDHEGFVDPEPALVQSLEISPLQPNSAEALEGAHRSGTEGKDEEPESGANGVELPRETVCRDSSAPSNDQSSIALGQQETSAKLSVELSHADLKSRPRNDGAESQISERRDQSTPARECVDTDSAPITDIAAKFESTPEINVECRTEADARSDVGVESKLNNDSETDENGKSGEDPRESQMQVNRIRERPGEETAEEPEKRSESANDKEQSGERAQKSEPASNLAQDLKHKTPELPKAAHKDSDAGPGAASKIRVNTEVDLSGQKSGKTAPGEDKPEKPMRPSHPKPALKNRGAFVSRFEEALRAHEEPKPKPLQPKPKPKGASSAFSGRLAAMQDLSSVLSRGLTPGAQRPKPQDPAGRAEKTNDSDSAEPTKQALSPDDSADAQLKAMPALKKKVLGPSRRKKLPENVKPRFSIIAPAKPLWEFRTNEAHDAYPPMEPTPDDVVKCPSVASVEPAGSIEHAAIKPALARKETNNSGDPVKHSVHFNVPVPSNLEPDVSQSSSHTSTRTSDAEIDPIQPIQPREKLIKPQDVRLPPESPRIEAPGPEGFFGNYSSSQLAGHVADNLKRESAEPDSGLELVTRTRSYDKRVQMEDAMRANPLTPHEPLAPSRASRVSLDSGRFSFDEDAESSGEFASRPMGRNTELDLRALLQRSLLQGNTSSADTSGLDDHQHLDLPNLGGLVDQNPSPSARKADLDPFSAVANDAITNEELEIPLGKLVDRVRHDEYE